MKKLIIAAVLLFAVNANASDYQPTPVEYRRIMVDIVKMELKNILYKNLNDENKAEAIGNAADAVSQIIQSYEKSLRTQHSMMKELVDIVNTDCTMETNY